MKQERFFILEGESGCGKSSLLKAALIPVVRTWFDVIECRVSDDPFGKLDAALRGVPYRQHEELTIVRSHLAAIGQKDESLPPAKPLLLCIDQFEEVFVTVKDEIRSRFVSFLKEAIERDRMRVLLAIRSDFRDLLDRLCREDDRLQTTLNLGSYYVLKAFRREQAQGVLEEMLRPLYGDDPLLKQQLTDFSKTLVLDLLRPPRDRRLSREDEKTVLAVELQTLGMIMEHLGTDKFSTANFRKMGGKSGLLRHYIEDAKDYVWHKTGVTGDHSLLILRELVSDSETKTAKTPSDVSAGLGLPRNQVEAVLKAFTEKYIVNTLPSELDSAELRYELMHEHLIQVLSDAPDPVLQKAKDAAERLAFWTSRTMGSLESASNSFLAKAKRYWAQPIPLWESLFLWRFTRSSEERRIIRSSVRGFVVRAVLACLVMTGILVSTADLWVKKIFRVTVNINFPATAVQKAADEIIENTWGSDKSKKR